MAEAPVAEFSTETKELADKLVGLTVKQAQELVDCLKDTHGIEPAGGGAVMMAAADGGAEAEEEQTSFDVELASFGDKKIQVIKVVRELTGLGLKEAKEVVDSAPSTVKEAATKAEAEEMQAKLEAVGAVVVLK